MAVYDSTVADNSAQAGGGIYVEDGCLTTALSDTIVAENTNTGSTSPDIYGVVTANYCLIGATAGVVFSGLSGDNILNVDPLLGVLGYYGGSTQTIPLLAGSPAIDAGADCTDSRRRDDRPAGVCPHHRCGVDIGAYELNDLSPFIVTTAQDIVDVTDALTKVCARPLPPRTAMRVRTRLRLIRPWPVRPSR